MYVSNGLIQLKINGVQAPTDVPYTSNSGKSLIFLFLLILPDLFDEEDAILQTSLKIKIALI